MNYLEDIGSRAKKASYSLGTTTTQLKNKAILKIAEALCENTDRIITANNIDIEFAKQNGMSESMLDRLMLDKDRISAIAEAARQVAELDDPVGITLDSYENKVGLKISKITVPMGVIGMIYEARPNVTVDAAVLCLKAGSAVILKGGKEAINSSICLADIMRDAISECGIDKDSIIMIEKTDRETTAGLMKLNGYLDLLIPRGGAGLISAVVANSTVPIIETGTGNCHIYIDEFADLDMAGKIVYNAKTSRPSVCNAAESLLIHQSVAGKALETIIPLLDSKGVIYHGCENTIKILGEKAILATDTDYATEYLAQEISIKIVRDINEAIDHIRRFSTTHSECIVTENAENAELFTMAVDSAAVYVNASTRFTDGGEFGLGAEIGISTQKLHARGPMGLREMTSYKYVIIGTGQTR